MSPRPLPSDTLFEVLSPFYCHHPDTIRECNNADWLQGTQTNNPLDVEANFKTREVVRLARDSLPVSHGGTPLLVLLYNETTKIAPVLPVVFARPNFANIFLFFFPSP